MTKQEFDQFFEDEILPIVANQFEQDGRPDAPARREAYNDLTDSYCKDGIITEHQYNTWAIPDRLETIPARR